MFHAQTDSSAMLFNIINFRLFIKRLEEKKWINGKAEKGENV